MSNPWDYIAKLVCIGDSGTGKSSLTIRLCEGRFSPSHDVTIGVEFGSRIVSVGPRTSSTSQSSPSGPQSTNGFPASSSQPSDAGKQQQKKMKLSLWDTAGQETYKSITRSYFRGASGALLVFDLTRRETFDSVTQWLDDLRQIAEPDIVVVLVGNKSDMISSDDSSAPTNSAAPPAEHTGLSSSHPSTKSTTKKKPRAISTSEAESYCASHNIIRYVETSAKSGHGVEAAFLEVAQRIYENIEKGRYDLNDRRSGVKGHGAGATGARQHQQQNQSGTVRLGMNDVTRGRGLGGGGGGGGRGAAGGCC